MDRPIFPEKFLESIATNAGFDAQSFTKIHQQPAAPTSIRLNPFKKTTNRYTNQVPWCNDGFYLKERPQFIFDPLFHSGCYYVQEASSMFIDTVIRQIKPLNTPVKILDLCAAPGGKSTLIGSLLKQDDLLVANEIIKTRVPVLTDNLSKWGSSNTIVSNNDARDFAKLPGLFDIVLADAPCSGSGMFRKDPDAMNEWSVDNVILCSQRQKRILGDVYPTIKTGGYLIYSTCSYSKEENEDILDWLCEDFNMQTVKIDIDEDWGIVETRSDKNNAYGYRFYPDKVAGEGLFAACLKKVEPQEALPERYSRQKNTLVKEIALLSSYIKDADNYHYFLVNGDWIAIDKIHIQDMITLQQNLYLKKSGVRIGKLAGKDLIPDHELALGLLLDREFVSQKSLNLQQAIAYLQKENIPGLDHDVKGWTLMTFENQALGWAKMLGNRMNNYYPKEQRILKRQ